MSHLLSQLGAKRSPDARALLGGGRRDTLSSDGSGRVELRETVGIMSNTLQAVALAVRMSQLNLLLAVTYWHPLEYASL